MKKDHPPTRSHGLTVEDDAAARYRATFHQAAIGVAHTAPDGAFLDTNPALAAMLGYSRRELLERRLVDLLLRNERRPRANLHSHDDLQRLLSGEIDVHACVEQYRHSDGRPVWVQRTASLASDAEGNPYLIHFIEDITEQRLTQERERAADLRYQRTLESALECIVSIDHLGRIVEFNPMAEKVFGYARADVLGLKLSEVLVPLSRRRRHEASMARLVAGDERSMLNRRIETIALKADGGTIPVELMMQRITDTDPPLFTGFLRDITQRKQAEARILRLNRLYRLLSHTSALIVRAPDAAALFQGVCRIARQHGGFVRPWVGLVDAKSTAVNVVARGEDDVEGSPRILVDAADKSGLGPVAIAIREARVVVCNDAALDALTAPWRERFEKQGIKSLAVVPLKTSDRVVGVLVLKSAVQDYFDDDIQQLLREMADELRYALDRLNLERKHREAEQRLAHLAHYDQLTGLPNRGLLYERLLHGVAQAARHGWTLAVLYIDLDRFKTVNDTMGHTLGDELLRQVSTRLLECVRAEDTVSRFSSDEFAVVLANLAHAGDAALVAAKVLGRLKQPYAAGGLQVVVSASIGMTLYPQDGHDADILMRNADVAMYNAKSRGRDNYQFYTAEMNARARERLELESRLRGALERDEFLLHYQPKVDVESGAICGFEALLRWQPPGEPLVPPGRFIPLLEETGLIRPVGEWVLRAACGQIAAWRKDGLKPVPVAINLSPRQLRQAGFCEAAAGALRESGVEAELIEVEITESSLMENPDEAHKTLDELKAVGFSLAIDDFGTGYSSLAYLKRFPFDTLKIDRSFVSDIETDADDATIARTIIALAGSLSLTVVAEGVENEQQFAFLAANRCDQAQGYLFSRPVPAEEATVMLKSGAPLHAPVARTARSPIPAVLVVDAEGERLVHVQQLLQRDGYQVLTASAPEDALDMLANGEVVVAIVDQSIGEARSAELLRRMAVLDPRVCRILVGTTVDRRALGGVTRDGTVQRYFVRGRDDQLLRDEVRKVTRRVVRGPGPLGALTRKPTWGLNLRRRRKKAREA